MEPPRSQLDFFDGHTPGPAAPEKTAGLDEAGRGCLAGPVVAAAVILPASFDLPFLGDSKKLPVARRNLLAPLIKLQAVAWSFGVVWPARIDQINILRASLEAMAIAASTLKSDPDLLLVDGNQKISETELARFWTRTRESPPPAQRPIIGGDAIIPCISAASVLAKTFRDRLMTSLGRLWPEYGFELHKGYGTKRHLKALADFGPCRMHRLTFRGVRPNPLQYPGRAFCQSRPRQDSIPWAPLPISS